jgi:ERCC4-type nuclease
LGSLAVERTVLVDKREFKSLLPSYLFHHGFKVVPVFLENADYILSNNIAVEKKSVHTRDLHESLRSGRLN